jgi:hypothetical protein
MIFKKKLNSFQHEIWLYINCEFTSFKTWIRKVMKKLHHILEVEIICF